MRDWLRALTQAEDHLLWTWVAVVVGYAVVGLVLGRRARARAAARAGTPEPEPSTAPKTGDLSSR